MKILHKDKDLIIVSKPPYLLSVPGRYEYKKDSVTYRLQKQFPFAREVHRLDWETSGIMVVALNKEAHRSMSIQFQERQTKKEYIAWVYGNLEKGEERLIDYPLALDWENRPHHRVDYEKGKPSQTFLTVDQYFKDFTRVILRPITGRSHQLRVHMQAIGHPILGDGLYAAYEQRERAARLMLHAQYLAFTHPYTEKWMEIKAPAPF